jgi:hypothetical protein
MKQNAGKSHGHETATPDTLWDSVAEAPARISLGPTLNKRVGEVAE